MNVFNNIHERQYNTLMHITDKLAGMGEQVLRLMASHDQDARNELFRRKLNYLCAIRFAGRRKTMTNAVQPTGKKEPNA